MNTTLEKSMAKEMGIRLHMLRTKKNMSQAELAKKLNTTQAFVSEWQSGHKVISTKYLYRICKAFEIPWDYFNIDNKDYLDYLKD